MKKYKIGEVCSLNEKTISRIEDIEIEYLDTSSITENNIDATQSVSLFDAPSRAQRLVKHHTIIYSLVRPKLEHHGIMDSPPSNLVVSTGFVTLDIKDEFEKDIDAYYLYLYLTQDRITQYLNTIAENSVSAYPTLSPKNIADIELSLPSIDVQQRVTSIISKLDRKIALNRAINHNLEAMAKQLYDYWFVQFDFPDENGKPYKSSGGKMVWNEKLKREIPNRWDAAFVKDVTSSIERGISYSSKEISSPKGHPMINLACYTKKGNYRVGEMKFFSGNVKESDKVYPYDLLIACTDMTQGADVIGRPILATEENDWFVYSMDLAKITPKIIGKMYLYYTLRTPFYHKYIKPFASGTTVKHLNVKGVENYNIPIPPNALQLLFEEITTNIKRTQMLSMNENIKLTKQRDELLPLLMNGQVSVNYDLTHG